MTPSDRLSTIERLECGRCGGLTDSYARPGRCVNEHCDAPMVSRRYVPEAEVQQWQETALERNAALDAETDEKVSLLGEVERLREENEKLRAALQDVADNWPWVSAASDGQGQR